jgi:hypothetical protein
MAWTENGLSMKEGRIAVNNKVNINQENNIMLTTSTSSDRTSNVARPAVAALAGLGLRIRRTLLWLVLPFTLTAGCASGPDRTVAGDYPPPAIDLFPSPLAPGKEFHPTVTPPDYTREFVRDPVEPEWSPVPGPSPE